MLSDSTRVFAWMGEAGSVIVDMMKDPMRPAGSVTCQRPLGGMKNLVVYGERERQRCMPRPPVTLGPLRIYDSVSNAPGPFGQVCARSVLRCTSPPTPQFRPLPTPLPCG